MERTDRTDHHKQDGRPEERLRSRHHQSERGRDGKGKTRKFSRLHDLHLSKPISVSHVKTGLLFSFHKFMQSGRFNKVWKKVCIECQKCDV